LKDFVTLTGIFRQRHALVALYLQWPFLPTDWRKMFLEKGSRVYILHVPNRVRPKLNSKDDEHSTSFKKSAQEPDEQHARPT
jgi:hypothetical protein